MLMNVKSTFESFNLNFAKLIINFIVFITQISNSIMTICAINFEVWFRHITFENSLHVCKKWFFFYKLCFFFIQQTFFSWARSRFERKKLNFIDIKNANVFNFFLLEIFFFFWLFLRISTMIIVAFTIKNSIDRVFDTLIFCLFICINYNCRLSIARVLNREVFFLN